MTQQFLFVLTSPRGPEELVDTSSSSESEEYFSNEVERLESAHIPSLGQGT